MSLSRLADSEFDREQPDISGFPKFMRLSGPSRVDRLFALGLTFSHFPFRIFYRTDALPLEAAQVDLDAIVDGAPFAGKRVPLKEAPLPRVVFVVPKRGTRRAHERNLIRRRLREAYRLGPMASLVAHTAKRGQGLDIGILFTGAAQSWTYDQLDQALSAALARVLRGHGEVARGRKEKGKKK